MRRPNPTELEYAFAAALIGLPMAYYVARWLLAMLGAL
jgi:hypothetical protein